MVLFGVDARKRRQDLSRLHRMVCRYQFRLYLRNINSRISLHFAWRLGPKVNTKIRLLFNFWQPNSNWIPALKVGGFDLRRVYPLFLWVAGKSGSQSTGAETHGFKFFSQHLKLLSLSFKCCDKNYVSRLWAWLSTHSRTFL